MDLSAAMQLGANPYCLPCSGAFAFYRRMPLAIQCLSFKDSILSIVALKPTPTPCPLRGVRVDLFDSITPPVSLPEKLYILSATIMPDV